MIQKLNTTNRQIQLKLCNCQYLNTKFKNVFTVNIKNAKAPSPFWCFSFEIVREGRFTLAWCMLLSSKQNRMCRGVKVCHWENGHVYEINLKMPNESCSNDHSRWYLWKCMFGSLHRIVNIFVHMLTQLVHKSHPDSKNIF